MIYWKRGIYFGKTTEKGLKDLRDVDINVKTISSVYFHVLSFIKYMIESTAEIVCDEIVAIATPSVFILNTTTNTILRITFTTPPTEEKMRGLTVSPRERIIPAQKLYIILGTDPRKYIRT